MKRSAALVIGLALVCGSVVGVSAPAGAAPGPVTCGARITTDTMLDRDLVDCPSHGLVIAADNITLDLNGHVVDGNAMAAAECPDGPGRCDVGVSNPTGHSGVTIRGGSITDFSIGVRLARAADNALSRLTVSGHLNAGVELDGVSQSRVERSSITGNGLTTGAAGVTILGSRGVVIEGNDISRSGNLGLSAVSSSRTTVRGNRLVDNPETAILLDGDENTLSGNSFVRSGGISFGGDRNRVVDNVLADVPWCGYDGCGSAIQLVSGLGNRMSGNVIQRAPSGIDVESYEGLVAGTVVSGNVVDSARGTGITVDVSHGDGALEGTLLERNVVTRAGDHGIDVENASTTLTGNIAVGNGKLGIEAIAGVTDGGDNYAAGNGSSPQCVHVSCGG